MLQLLKNLLILGILPPLALIAFFVWASAGSYPDAKYNEIVNYASSSPDSQPHPDRFTVITYNIGYLSGLANAAGTSAIEPTPQLFAANRETAIAALHPQQADLIGLQEIDLEAQRSYRQNQVDDLAKALGMRAAAVGVNWDKNYVPFPFWPLNQQFGHTVAAQALFSRYPITHSERILLEKVASQPFYYQAFYLDRVAQVVQIDINGKPLVVINVHLEAFDEPTRRKQTQVVKDLAEDYADQYPVLLIGDFNSSLTRSTEANPTINLLLQSTQFQSAVPVEQLRDQSHLTFPSNAPVDIFDYIFYTPERIEILESQVITAAAQASDHLPLLAKFRLR